MATNELKLFKQQKLTCLSKADFSRKGSVDEPISELIHFINGCDRYFTTSSCSGRICLFEEPKISTRKKGCNWLHITHDACDWLILIDGIKKSTADASLKFEPFVLHVQCASLPDAQTVHEVAVSSGFRNSGLTVGKRGKIMANVRSTHSLEIPVTRNGVQIVSNEYIEYAVDLANGKMKENLERINRFYENLKQAVTERSHNDMQSGTAGTNERRKRNIRKNKADEISNKATVATSMVSTDELSQEIADKVNFEECALEYVFREET